MRAVTHFFILLALSSVLFVGQIHADPVIEDSVVESESNRPVLRSTGGCLGGALIGSIVPVLGNLVGCAVGGAIAYFGFGPDDENEEPLESEAISKT